MNTPKPKLSGLLQWATTAALLPIACASLAVAQTGPSAGAMAGRAVSDKPLQRHREQLLELAYEAASALPNEPHIKSRSRVQEEVVAVCLELDQPWRAVRFSTGIANWRRGGALADIAAHFAQQGDVAQATHYSDLAKQNLEETRQAETQSWRLQVVQAKIAAAQALLDDLGADDELAEISDADFAERVGALDALLTRGSFEQIQAATEECAALFDRYYPRVSRRSLLEEKIKTLLNEVPRQIRIEQLIELGSFALAHGDPDKARSLAEEGRLTLDSVEWRPEDSVTLAAKLAELRWRAGDRERARSELAAALEMFEATQNRIADIYRPGTLRPIAEAFTTMGDEPAALRLYVRVVEGGVVNPNSRPRAEDLAATCCSMIACGFEPPPSLLARMVEIRRGLDHPW